MVEVPIVPEFPAWIRTIIEVAAVFVGVFIFNWVVRRAIGRFLRRVSRETSTMADEQVKRARTVSSVLRNAVSALLWTTALLIALGRAGINIAPLLAAAGIGGLAIGFGAQNVVRDFLAGVFILVEDQYHVGDVVGVAGVAGVVEDITLRTTTLRDLEGRVHTVPNGEIRVTTNLTKGYSRFLLDLPVPYDENVDRVAEIVRAVVEDMRKEPTYAGKILKPLEVLGVDAYGPSEIVLRMYVDTLPGEQWPVGRELRRRIKSAYDAAGISIPYPHRQIIVKNAGDDHRKEESQ